MGGPGEGNGGDEEDLQVVGEKQQPEVSNSTALQPDDAIEAEPALRLTVDRPCRNPEGYYIGLSKVQRERLGVVEGDTVVLVDPRTSLESGPYVVGKGHKDLASEPEKFAANNVIPGSEVEVVRKKSIEGKTNRLPLQKGAESDERHERRKQKIIERFGAQGLDGEAYIVVPTGLATQFMIDNEKTGDTSKPTIAAISLGQVRVGGETKTIPIVPSGTSFGMTSKAAEVLNVPSGINSDEVEVGIINGVLVVNQFVSKESV